MNNLNDEIYKLLVEQYRESREYFVIDTQLGGVEESVFYVLDDSLTFRIGEIRFETDHYKAVVYGADVESKCFNVFLDAYRYIDYQHDELFDSIDEYMFKAIFKFEQTLIPYEIK